MTTQGLCSVNLIDIELVNFSVQYPFECDTIFVLLLFHVFITAHTIGHIM